MSAYGAKARRLFGTTSSAGERRGDTSKAANGPGQSCAGLFIFTELLTALGAIKFWLGIDYVTAPLARRRCV